MVWLLDANVLIAVVDEEHVHHSRVMRWVEAGRRYATSPVVQGALVRHLVRTGTQPSTIDAILRQLTAAPNHEFWPDALPYAEADLSRVIGHRQVTDAYLVSLVRAHGPDARLATLDRGLAQMYPDVVDLVGPGRRPDEQDRGAMAIAGVVLADSATAPETVARIAQTLPERPLVIAHPTAGSRMLHRPGGSAGRAARDPSGNSRG